ncbi:MAG: hemW [Crocinitomicaceae bacterium]|jgi:oxygen-independent coproporphyrinogen-3 oxidase|nr:hemW [Crocinitomicaceae bacterium]
MAGIYFHIPFCKQKCTYCDFHFSTSFAAYETQMIGSMRSELEMRQNELNFPLDTIYFGGGTPSIAQMEGLEELLQSARRNFDVAADAEITLEANPDDITAETIAGWKAMGINRLSIGIQSFDAPDLLWMNRAHNVKESLDAVKIAQQGGISNISIDLIYGLPDMDADRWKKQLALALELGVKHISAYCLTVEKKTALNQLVKSKQIKPASNDMQAAHFEILQESLKQAGFVQYEVSNFGKPGFFSRHNSAYWKGEHYLGIGPSAHSFDGKSRSWNIANNRLYMQSIAKNELPLEREILEAKDRFNELLLTGLRTSWGIKLEQLANILPFSSEFERRMKELLSQQQAEIKNGHLILTETGMLYADRIALDLFY